MTTYSLKMVLRISLRINFNVESIKVCRINGLLLNETALFKINFNSVLLIATNQ